MFDQLPSDPGDEDEPEASSEAALERERALQALRVSVAKRWAFIFQMNLAAQTCNPKC